MSSKSHAARRHRPDEPLVDIRMKKLYNTLEPNVINNKLLTRAVYEQGPKDEAGKIAKEEGIEFGTVKSLRLDFKNILYISNLWQFNSLTHLQLVHNIIEKIENLNPLITLEWLDLSFNKIEKIEGLDNLVRLTDLSLYHNRIKTIENLDALELLNVFSIGKNFLSNIENVLYLKKFKNLKSLNLAGNPMCESSEYFSLIFAFFSDLMFLDYKLITRDEHQASYEKYSIKVEQFKEKETEHEKKLYEQKITNEARKIHKKAFVDLLDTDALFIKMVYEDPEIEKMMAITGFEEILSLYKEKIQTILLDLFNKGIKELERRNRDSDLFFTCINAAKNENNQKASDFISEFNIFKDEVFYDINTTNIIDEPSMRSLKEKTYVLWNNLMSLEVQLYDQLEDTIKDYLRNLTEMVESFLEIVNNYFSQIRDLESAFTERVSEAGCVVFDKVQKGDMNEEKMNKFKKFDIFNDKDVLTNTLSACHDYRLLAIDTWQDGIKVSATQWLEETNQHIRSTEEHVRNRQRITEINNFIDHVRSEIENFEIPGIALN